jgi:hypothetical protein
VLGLWTFGCRLRDGGVREALLTSAAAGLLVHVDEAYALPAAVALLLLGAQRSSRRLTVALAAPFALAIALRLAWRSALGGFAEPEGPLVQGLVGLLGSTGKGIFLYAPPLALALFGGGRWWREDRADALLASAFCAVALLSVAGCADWHGDPAWGPRRLTPLLPLLFLPAAHGLAMLTDRIGAPARWVTSALLALGLGVQLLGAAVAPSAYLQLATFAKNASGAPGWFGAEPTQCHFIPQLSPIVGHAWLVRHLAVGATHYRPDTPWRLLVPTTPSISSAKMVEWDLFAVELEPVPRLLAGCGLLAVALVAFGSLVSVLRSRR